MAGLAGYIFAVSLIVTVLLTPAAIRLGRRWEVLDHPGPRKVHTESVPLSGGWAIFAVLTLILWGHLLGALAIRSTGLVASLPERVQYFLGRTPELVAKIGPIYAGAALIFLLGLVDDVRRMSVRSRLVYQIGVAAGVVALGARPGLGFLPSWASALIGIIWIVGITNAFNFLDGLDGLSTGVAFVGTAALLAVMAIGNQPDMLFFLAALAGIQVGFLFFNFNPARLFLGSSGSLLLGYLMAVSTLLTTYMVRPGDNWLMPLLTPLFILAIPIYDTSSVVLIRLLRRRSIAIADQSHFHHRMMRLGFSHRQTVVFICLVAFAISISAVLLVRATIRQSALILVQIVAILSILMLAERVAARLRREVLERRREASAKTESEEASLKDETRR